MATPISDIDRWHNASIKDGDSHRAKSIADGVVTPKCDREPFVPISSPAKPTDPEHACPACLTKERGR